jgi:peptidyl-prolyl cis-trans isomerase B (cyclophilin B)
MNPKRLLPILLLLAAVAFSGCESVPADADAKISTDYGAIYVRLYGETPKHKENFLKLAEEGFFDGTTFHRVIQEFMVQGGDPNTKGATGRAGEGGPGYTLQREILPQFFHKKGALAAARMSDQANPNWESSGSQFYLVVGKKYTDVEMDQMEQQAAMAIENHVSAQWQADPKNGWVRTVDLQALQTRNPDSFALVNARIQQEYGDFRKGWPAFKLTPEQREVYRTVGGTPFLDASYTVFGEVVGGMEVLEKISKVKTGAGDAPVEEIKMTVKVLK